MLDPSNADALKRLSVRPGMTANQRSVEANIADGGIEFARLHGCQNETQCVIHGGFSAGLDVTLLSRDGAPHCRGKTVGESKIPSEVMGPAVATAVRLENCSKNAAYFLAVLTGRIRSFKVADIRRIRHPAEETAIELLARQHGIFNPEKYEKDAQALYDNTLLRVWRHPSDEQITAVADRGVALYSYRVDGVDARLAVFNGTSPYEINGPTVFVRNRKPVHVTNIFYRGNQDEANKSMIGFSLNGEQYLFVSGSWCEGCGHHGVELHRLDKTKSVPVYHNADGST